MSELSGSEMLAIAELSTSDQENAGMMDLVVESGEHGGLCFFDLEIVLIA